MGCESKGPESKGPSQRGLSQRGLNPKGLCQRVGRSILSKVQKMFVPGCFPIHMDPLTSPSEKNSKKIDTSYWSKQAEVLLYDVVYSDFSPIT